jgi:hypothetical protein
MQHINLSPPLTTPKDKMVEQYRIVGELVMPDHYLKLGSWFAGTPDVAAPPPTSRLALSRPA